MTIDGQRYEVLRYRGNVTGHDGAQPGRILGGDELTRPYEVIDATYDPAADLTTVQLQYASNENIVAGLMAGGRVVAA